MCGARSNAPDGSEGKVVKCGSCKKRFVLDPAPREDNAEIDAPRLIGRSTLRKGSPEGEKGNRDNLHLASANHGIDDHGLQWVAVVLGGFAALTGILGTIVIVVVIYMAAQQDRGIWNHRYEIGILVEVTFLQFLMLRGMSGFLFLIVDIAKSSKRQQVLLEEIVERE